MDDYTREMMDLKTLVTRTLEKKGVLAKIRAELRASVFEAIEDEDKVIEQEESLPPALLGSCNDQAKQLHNSPSVSGSQLALPGWDLLVETWSSSPFPAARLLEAAVDLPAFVRLVSTSYCECINRGRLLTALICEYLDWAQLNHTLKVYLPECNLPKDSWKSELKEFSSKNGYDLNRNGDSAPLLLDVLEGFLKYENFSQARGAGRRLVTQGDEFLSNTEARNIRKPSSSSVAGGLPPLGRPGLAAQSSDRRASSSISGYRKDEYNWRYENKELPQDVMLASSALENLQLDRKAWNLSTSWRHRGDGNSEDDGTVE
ncbi:hypothetical protein RND71_010813 [Anisodus tanguticus]|uniref:LisH domain-containing protein n=1 Tax=Anisodus tanguticus TaxID=243964 RepID=A0AAE1SHS9_9SOLA|nr:hypothetical protein RND71_010813 [Anisodus tanguticus]